MIRSLRRNANRDPSAGNPPERCTGCRGRAGAASPGPVWGRRSGRAGRVTSMAGAAGRPAPGPRRFRFAIMGPRHGYPPTEPESLRRASSGRCVVRRGASGGPAAARGSRVAGHVTPGTARAAGPGSWRRRPHRPGTFGAPEPAGRPVRRGATSPRINDYGRRADASWPGPAAAPGDRTVTTLRAAAGFPAPAAPPTGIPTVRKNSRLSRRSSAGRAAGPAAPRSRAGP